MNLLESQYYTKSCSSSPDIMYGFSVTDVFNPASNDTLAPMFEMVTQDYEYGVCGYDLALSQDCCYQSLDLELSNGFNSAIHSIITDNIFETMPTTTNGVSYCALEAITSDSLFGYSYIFVKANGECIADQYQCTNTGFTIYENITCTGDNITIPISLAKYQSASNSLIPSNYIWLFSNTVGKHTFSWVAYTPSKLLVTNTGMLGAYLFMTYGLCLVICLYLVLESVISIRKLPKLFSAQVTLFSSLNWMFYIILKFIFVVYPFPDSYLMAIESEVLYICQNFATFAVIWNPYNMMAILLELKSWLKSSILSLCVMIHIGLAGGNYFYFFENYPNEWVTVVGSWQQQFVLYVFFLFLWNLVPQTLLAVRILFPSNAASLKFKLQELHHVDHNFFYFVFGDIVVFVLYVILYGIMNYTEILQNDEVYQALYCYQDFLFLAHNLVSIQVAKVVKHAYSKKGTAGESYTHKIGKDDSKDWPVTELST